ncbi:polyadenylate-binding protein 1-like [Henckelia pumila]|uniref:polyadenylate-binding protein 1-like n=1 Tax=Henckelia pumila TaxID=405737 RepID=UPI003C6E0A73
MSHESLNDSKREIHSGLLRHNFFNVVSRVGNTGNNISTSKNSRDSDQGRSRFLFPLIKAATTCRSSIDYACIPEDVQQRFQSRGNVNRVPNRTNKFGQPKGYAYVEFLESEDVEQAILLSESELHGRQLKVSAM